jgi:hypothetical protein
MTHTLLLEWTGSSGNDYIEVVTFSVKEETVAVVSASADSQGKILSNASMTYTLKQGRRHYKRCLEDGFKLVDQAPKLSYSS